MKYMLTTLQVLGDSCSSELHTVEQGMLICDAARREDLQAVEALLSAKAPVHFKNPNVGCCKGLDTKWREYHLCWPSPLPVL